MYLSNPRRLKIVLGSLVGASSIVAGLLLLRGGEAQSATDCSGKTDYPFTSIPCDLYQGGSKRVARAEPEKLAQVAISRDEAIAAARKLAPDDEVLEAELVYSWSADAQDPLAARQMLWAVSVRPADGIFISGGAIAAKEIAKVRPDGDNRPLSPQEEQTVAAAVQREMQSLRDSIKESYRVVYVDPQTGEYLGSAEGAR